MRRAIIPDDAGTKEPLMKLEFVLYGSIIGVETQAGANEVSNFSRFILIKRGELR